MLVTSIYVDDIKSLEHRTIQENSGGVRLVLMNGAEYHIISNEEESIEVRKVRGEFYDPQITILPRTSNNVIVI